MFALLIAVVLSAANICFAGTTCVGDEQNNSFSFSADPSSEGSLAITRTLNGKSQGQAVDMNGYLSSEILVGYLTRGSKGSSTIAASSKSDTLRLLKLRLNLLKTTLTQGGSTANSDAVKKIDALNSVLNQSSISRADLTSSWMRLSQAVQKVKPPIATSASASGATAWGPLPDVMTDTNAACEPETKEVKLGNAIDGSISKTQPSYTKDSVVDALLKMQSGQ